MHFGRELTGPFVCCSVRNKRAGMLLAFEKSTQNWCLFQSFSNLYLKIWKTFHLLLLYAPDQRNKLDCERKNSYPYSLLNNTSNFPTHLDYFHGVQTTPEKPGSFWIFGFVGKSYSLRQPNATRFQVFSLYLTWLLWSNWFNELLILFVFYMSYDIM